MPKRKSSRNTSSFKRLRTEEVLVKCEELDSCELPGLSAFSSISESSTETNSLESEVYKKTKNKRSSHHSSEKFYRMFKRDMELFQRSIDVKFSYLENLIQNVLRNQREYMFLNLLVSFKRYGS